MSEGAVVVVVAPRTAPTSSKSNMEFGGGVSIR